MQVQVVQVKFDIASIHSLTSPTISPPCFNKIFFNNCQTFCNLQQYSHGAGTGSSLMLKTGDEGVEKSFSMESVLNFERRKHIMLSHLWQRCKSNLMIFYAPNIFTPRITTISHICNISCNT